MSENMESQKPEKLPLPLWRRILFVILLVMTSYIAVRYVIRIVRDNKAEGAINAELMAIKESGGPLSFAEFDKKNSVVSSGHDSTEKYTLAIQLLKDVDIEQLQAVVGQWRQGLGTMPLAKPSEQVMQNTGAIVAKYGNVLALIDEAARLEGCGYDLQMDLGLEVVLENLKRLKIAANLISVRTSLLIVDGKTKLAIDSVLSLLRLDRVYGRRPAVMAWEARMTGLILAANDARMILEFGRPGSNDTKRLQEGLQGIDLIGGVPRLLVGERIWQLGLMAKYMPGSSLEILRAAGMSVPAEAVESTDPIVEVRGMYATYLRSLAAVSEVMKADWPAACQAVDGLVQQAGGDEAVRAIYESFATVCKLTNETVTRLGCAQAAVAVMGYYESWQSLPENLELLVPDYISALPVDPLNGEVLNYQSQEHSFAVYGSGGVAAEAGSGQATERTAPQKSWGTVVRIFDGQEVDPVVKFVVLGEKYFREGDYTQAVANWEQAIALKYDMVQILNNLAWLGAVDPSAKFYNPSLALKRITQACELTENKHPGLLDTLAIVQAANGDFENAVKTAGKAADMAVAAKVQALADDIATRIALYEQGNPYVKSLGKK